MSDLLTIKIAGINIGIRALHEGFDEFCEDFIVSEAPDFILSATEADLVEEKKRIVSYMDETDYSDPELEKLWVYRQIAETIPKYDAFLIHAASVCIDEDAFLFIGPSGAGKTTQAKLWEQCFGDRFRIINDDKPIIKVTENGILVCGSPWCGKEKWTSNLTAPLRGIIRIEQSDRNKLEPMDSETAWEALMNQVYRSTEPNTMHKILSLVDALIGPIPIYGMKCTMDNEAIKTVVHTLKREGDL